MVKSVAWHNNSKPQNEELNSLLDLLHLSLNCDVIAIVSQSNNLFFVKAHHGGINVLNHSQVSDLLSISLSDTLAIANPVSELYLSGIHYPSSIVCPIKDEQERIFALLIAGDQQKEFEFDTQLLHCAKKTLTKHFSRSSEQYHPDNIDFRAILDSLPVMIAHVGDDDTIIFANRTYVNYFHILGESLIGVKIADVVNFTLNPNYKLAMEQVRCGKVTTFERSIHVMREQKHLELTFIPSGTGRDFYIFSQDITHLKDSQKDLEHKAFHDPLTGLPNRAYFERAIKDVMACRNAKSALLFIDIDGLKRINDKYGHVTGDKLIRHFAQILEDSIRGCDIAFRFAGDEFTVLVTKLEHPEAQTEQLCHDLINKLPLMCQSECGETITTSFSIGATIIDPKENSSYLHWLAQADQAMYQTKTAGKGNFTLFEQCQIQANPIGRPTL